MATVAYVRSGKLIELLREVDPKSEMLVSIVNGCQLALGRDPLRPASVIDFSNETHSAVAPANGAAVPAKAEQTPQKSTEVDFTSRVGRVSGQHWFELKGKKRECRSVKDLLLQSLKAIEAERPGTLEKLSGLRKRTKKIVAREPNQLFLVNKHLVKDHAEQLMGGWWVGTNNSSQETEAWLRQAAEYADLSWGREFKTSL
jgi:hypothetical protein